MLTLGIDTSNYAASLAVFDTTAGEVVYDCKRLLPVPAGRTGLRQSDALFHQTALLPQLFAQLARQAPLRQVEAVGVSARPRAVEGSYMPCFLAGVSAATAFCAARELPLVQTTHQQGHIAAARFAAGIPESQSALVFHVSGGTTDLLLCRPGQPPLPLGASRDLYAGQAVDRLGVKLGFAFPAGAEVSARAAQCSRPVHAKASVQGMDCSLSGLENQCEALLRAGEDDAYVCRYCLACIAQTLYRMACAALGRYPGSPVVFAGGVMSSEIIRDDLLQRLPAAHFVPARFSGDNAIGVAILAAQEVGAWPTISQ